MKPLDHILTAAIDVPRRSDGWPYNYRQLDIITPSRVCEAAVATRSG